MGGEDPEPGPFLTRIGVFSFQSLWKQIVPESIHASWTANGIPDHGLIKSAGYAACKDSVAQPAVQRALNVVQPVWRKHTGPAAKLLCFLCYDGIFWQISAHC